MSNVSIGVTAMELFAYNPFRILGVAVNTPTAQIEQAYTKLMRLAESGEGGSYTTPFDFDSLPPFSRTAQTVKTAYGKLSSTGYRCFAYADSEFLVSLNIDDIMLNLRDISCYDCFLRCYMWLIINDRSMEEVDPWIMLAKHIDKLIKSTPDEWEKYFDNRFPEVSKEQKAELYKSFHSTFCQIILLPIKEMVRGSMRCTTAADILKCVNIDVDGPYEYIEIPQANAPAPGEPNPKLKLALKYGDEYFDISTGTMKHYSADTEAAESNSFAQSAVAPLEVEDIAAEEPAAEEYAEPAYEAEEAPAAEAYNEPAAECAEEYTEPEPEASEPEYAPEPEPQTAPAEQPEKPTRRLGERKGRRAEPAPAPTPAPQPARPSRREAPKPQTTAAPAPEAPKPAPRTAPAPTPAAAEPKPAQRRTSRSMKDRTAENVAPAKTNADFSSANPFSNTTKQSAPKPEQQSKRVVTSGYTKLVKEAEKKEEERAASLMELEEEESENAYTNALIEMLKSNQLRGETMKSADTRCVVKDSDLIAPAPTSASMDSINMKKYDDKLLASPYEMAPRKLTREERYRNVKIDDMLNPGGVGQNYGMSAIEQYKKNKAKQKQTNKAILATTAFFALALIVFALFWLLGII